MQHLQPNTTLQGGKYRIGRVLGQGGFGITYLAVQISLQRKVAIKEFFMKDFCSRDENTLSMQTPSVGSSKQVELYRKKFVKEANNLARLNHPNIISVIDVFEENNTIYYVMPYLSGGSLDYFVKSHGALSEEEAMKYVKQIADALNYMHKEIHICHYDVKPANILLDEKGNAILIDFGISKNYDASGHETSTTPIGLSEGYAPIEQYQQGVDEFSPVSDVYGLGATLFYLVHARRPEPSILRAGGERLQIDSHLSQNMKDLLNASMMISKSERPQSVNIFLEDINTIGNLRPSNQKYNEDESTIISTSKEETIVSSSEDTSKQTKTSDTGNVNNSYIWWIVGIASVLILSFVVLINNKKTESVFYEKRTNEIVEETRDSVQETNNNTQQGSSTISENYAGRKYNYNIKVENGELCWTFSGEGGKDSKKLSCNPDVNADIIIAEFKGLAYWGIANGLIWEMVEEQQVYNWDLHAGAKEALGKCVSSLAKAKDNCPNAYKKAHEMYKDLINAENAGADPLWEELTILSFGMGEYPLSVCDIY